MILILAASILAGFTYNRTTPLGVRFNQPAEAVSRQAIGSNVIQVVDTPSPKTTNYVAMPEGAGPMPTPKYPIPSIKWAEMKPLLAANKLTLIDARSHIFFDAGHIPDAICIPSGNNFDMSTFSEQHTNKSELVVVYCSSDHCPLSWLVAAGLINNFGFANVKIMPGGFEEYQRAEAGAAKGQSK